MAGRLSLLKDRTKRPRLFLWTAILLVSFVTLAAVGVIGTSTNWFCTAPCHTVHYDNTLTYEQSSHIQVSCVACHEPLNGTPLEFVLLKIEVAPDLVPTIMGTTEFPLNHAQDVATEMPDEQCLQCHDVKKRVATTRASLTVDHEKHLAKGVRCTSCHNRVAHPEENVDYVLEGDTKHEDWLTMQACFRCHGLTRDAKAPGMCSNCHPENFELRPADHEVDDWLVQTGGGAHAVAGAAEAKRTAEGVKWVEELAAEPERPSHGSPFDRTYERPGFAKTVNNCYTCHVEEFCTTCHNQ